MNEFIVGELSPETITRALFGIGSDELAERFSAGEYSEVIKEKEKK